MGQLSREWALLGRWVAGAAAAVVGAAIVLASHGFARPADEKSAVRADDKKADDKKANDKKTDEKKPEFDPKDVRVGPPPELAALRAAVEEAARKGENVDEIRKQLESLEKALAGKPWVKPKVAEEPLPPPAAPNMPQPGQFFPGGRIRPGAPIPLQPVFPGALQPGLIGPPGVMGGGNGRLGLRIGAVPPGVAEDAGVPAGRGILIDQVVPGSIAEKVGFQADDIVIEFAGRRVTDEPSEFIQMVREAKGGEKMDAVVIRKGKKETIKGIEFPAVGVPVPVPVPIPAPPLPVGGKGKSVSVQVVNGVFTITAEEDGVKVVIEGQANGGKPAPSRITVTEGGKTVEATAIDKLPAAYQERVRGILDGAKLGR